MNLDRSAQDVIARKVEEALPEGWGFVLLYGKAGDGEILMSSNVDEENAAEAIEVAYHELQGRKAAPNN